MRGKRDIGAIFVLPSIKCYKKNVEVQNIGQEQEDYINYSKEIKHGAVRKFDPSKLVVKQYSHMYFIASFIPLSKRKYKKEVYTVKKSLPCNV